MPLVWKAREENTMKSGSPFSVGLNTCPLGRTVCSRPVGSLVCLLDEQADCCTEVPLAPAHQSQESDLFIAFHTFARGPTQAEPEVDPWKFSVDRSPSTFSFNL